MNIDLLFTTEGEAGLLASDIPLKKIAGILIDVDSGLLSIEYVDMDHFEMNIPVEPEFFTPLEHNQFLHIGAYKAGHIAQAYQIPLMFLDDPYRADILKYEVSKTPLMAFGSFVKKCITGQPVHREDLEDDEVVGCILGDAVPSSLEFAPHLARRLGMEAQPKAQPSAPGPSGPGLGGGSSGGGSYFKPIIDKDDED